MRRVTFLLLLLCGLLLSCGGSGASEPDAITLTLKEWQIEVSPAELGPGEALFQISNAGTRQHEFILVKSDLPLNQLPTTADNRADESKVNIIGRIEPLAAGATASLEVELFPGKYLLICNLVSPAATASGPPDPHYLNGMAQSLLVLDD